ncbi:hypothetical protein CDL15_Pgr011489 [Punica granatum]|uniref:Uncharacterized protein n=1 Tax=Punica granatum TaxID=22663 RepID=A0A218WG72_PUNGR|nr:hypothetical protein CDL15_Pgr011489 [Punica granatum]
MLFGGLYLLLPFHSFFFSFGFFQMSRGGGRHSQRPHHSTKLAGGFRPQRRAQSRSGVAGGAGPAPFPDLERSRDRSLQPERFDLDLSKSWVGHPTPQCRLLDGDRAQGKGSPTGAPQPCFT